MTKPNIEKHNMEIERERERIKDRERHRDKSNNDIVEVEHRPKGTRKLSKYLNILYNFNFHFAFHFCCIFFLELPTNMDTLESNSGCENGNTSPLYSNWDLTMQHLLPLQHYILEQAKLSGKCFCFPFGIGTSVYNFILLICFIGCYQPGDPLGGSGDSDSLHSSASASGSSARSLSGHEPDNEDSDRSGSNDGYLQHQPPPAPITHHHREDGNFFKEIWIIRSDFIL